MEWIGNKLSSESRERPDWWVTNRFHQKGCEGLILTNGEGDYVVRGTLPSGEPANSELRYWASNPIDRHQSYTGSGLPFPNPEIAFDNTPNQGLLRASGSVFEVKVHYPNGYYVNLGKNYVKPCVHFEMCKSKQHFVIDLPYDVEPRRSLSQKLYTPIYNRATGR